MVPPGVPPTTPPRGGCDSVQRGVDGLRFIPAQVRFDGDGFTLEMNVWGTASGAINTQVTVAEMGVPMFTDRQSIVDDYGVSREETPQGGGSMVVRGWPGLVLSHKVADRRVE
jgi:hypothetical protein